MLFVIVYYHFSCTIESVYTYESYSAESPDTL